jgi:hypothetical protein
MQEGTGNLAIAATVIAGAAAVSVACVPLYRGGIPRGHWYGLRFKKALESDANWQATNRYTARRMFIWSAVIACLGLTALLVPGQYLIPGLLIPALAPLLYVIPVVESARFARKL